MKLPFPVSGNLRKGLFANKQGEHGEMDWAKLYTRDVDKSS